MHYAGIGSRQTPPSVLHTMTMVAVELAHEGWTLRSGGARGADTAFAGGAEAGGGMMQIFLPSGPIPPWAFTTAALHHPAWHRCSDFARRAHARNCMIVLGEGGDDPVDKIICWTPGGQIVGGTGQALRIAIAHEIPVTNLWRPA